jgi:hypothetical protein
VAPQEQDVHRRFLPQKVVDAENLPLLQDPAQLVVQRPGRGQIVAEGFFHHDPSAGGEVGVGKSLYHQAEQRRRDLEVEDGTVPPLGRLGDSVIRLWIPKIAGDHCEALCEAAEYLFVDRLAGVLDGAARVIAEGRRGPVVEGHADDRAVEQLAALQTVQGAKGHLLRQISGDTKDHQNVRGRACRCIIALLVRVQRCRVYCFSSWPPNSPRL